MRMNPVYKNELKMSARSMQLPVLAVIFNSILSVVALIALYGIRQNYINSGGNPYHSMMILYVVVLTIEVVLLCLFVPSAAGGSIAGERERQTLDILLSSRMTVREIVTGKLLSCISMAVLLVVTSIPILAVTSMYGGMQLGLLYQSAAYVGFFILFAGSIGVFCSCRFKKTTYASISAYGLLIVLTIGTGLLVLLLNMVFGGGFGDSLCVGYFLCIQQRGRYGYGGVYSACSCRNYLPLAVESGHYLWYAYFSSDRRNRHSGGIIASNGSGTGGS